MTPESIPAGDVYKMLTEIRQDFADRFDNLYRTLGEQYISKGTYETICDRVGSLEDDLKSLAQKVWISVGVGIVAAVVLAPLIFVIIAHLAGK